MAKEEKGGGQDAVKDLKYFLLILGILGVVWLFTGGPLRPESRSGIFLNKPQQKMQNKASSQVKKIFGIQGPSLPSFEDSEETGSGTDGKTPSSPEKSFPATLTISATRAKETDPNKEYIKISAPKSNKKPVRLTDMKLEGELGLDISIKQGAPLIFPSLAENPKKDIYLAPGETAYIITGSSPIGESFRLNKCLGYMKQFHDFEPSIPSRCPLPKYEDLPDNLNDQCLDYIDKIPACKTFVSAPINLSTACQEYINYKINYKTCFELHQYDDDFYGEEWRVYLNRSGDIWKKSRETITLTDTNGKTIDSVSY